jgi:hypothetical protein
MTISHWINVTWHTVSLSSSDLSLDQWSVGVQTYSTCTCTILGFKGIPKCDNGHYMYLLYNSLPFIGISSICVE